jgi:hypothetical protein
MIGDVHDTAAFVDAHGDRSFARGYRRERVAAAATYCDDQRKVAHNVGSDVTTDAVEMPQRRGGAGCLRVGGLSRIPTFLWALDVCGLLAAAGAGSCDQ